MSESLKDLIKLLLQSDPNKRPNAADLKKHSFFANINFTELLQLKIKPPF